MPKPVVAVITGDLVKSRSYSNHDYENILIKLSAVLEDIKSNYTGQFDVFRGDSFQFITENIEYAAAATVMIRLALKSHTPSVDIRQSLGIASVASINDKVRISTGDAFILSGEGLDSIKHNLIVLRTKNRVFNQKIELLTKFLDVHLSGLTELQSLALLAYLKHPKATHAELGVLLNRSRLAVTKLLNMSHYALVSEYLYFYQENLPQKKDLL
ncbi:hypothetical protein [Pseudidiomarina gelatinasegens]|uniref:hypothetical protein n=1 Tax=Pseudidiomarina gelatinasegens TaxID=2487740 RepID=UPI003A982AD4